ncbi:hypothetical protein LMG29739_04295 [Paraburkholderia solisilvae]|uniref:Uncharacterized protein n=1 Tax=Paraburkholderia solisilvae TaxID=624376 RepID=A0A6J5ECR7_9BURK|nr:hypothetical protein LMG29739_04295 [Paraburkholderia solisilvae]
MRRCSTRFGLLVFVSRKRMFVRGFLRSWCDGNLSNVDAAGCLPVSRVIALVVVSTGCICIGALRRAGARHSTGY